jgi:hypothetical protein
LILAVPPLHIRCLANSDVIQEELINGNKSQGRNP